MIHLQTLGEGYFSVGNDLTIDAVPELWIQSKNLFPSANAAVISIDVSLVTNVDSGGLALLVAWARWANSRNKQFKVQGRNSKLAVLIENNHLEKLFYSS